MKIAGLHVLSHSDDNEHAISCTICDHAITNNLTPVLAAEIQDFTIEKTELIVSIELITDYSFIVSKTFASDQLVTRPPPFKL